MTPIYYINLDRVPERHRFMEGQFLSQGLSATRIPAVDAFDMAETPEYAPASWMQRWSLTKSEVACFESHRLAWRAIRDNEERFAVIMEDDAILSAGFSEALKALTKSVHCSDVIKLDGVNQVRRFGPAIDIGGVRLRTINQTIGSAAAYLISREAAAKLEARANRYCDTADDHIFTPRRDMALMQLDPAIAVQGMFVEDKTSTRSDTVAASERTSDHRINAVSSKGPVFYRLLKELRRSGRKLMWWLWLDRRLVANGGLMDCPPLAGDLGRYR